MFEDVVLSEGVYGHGRYFGTQVKSGRFQNCFSAHRYVQVHFTQDVTMHEIEKTNTTGISQIRSIFRNRPTTDGFKS